MYVSNFIFFLKSIFIAGLESNKHSISSEGTTFKGNITVLVVSIGCPARLLCWNWVQRLIVVFWWLLVTGLVPHEKHNKNEDDNDDMPGLVPRDQWMKTAMMMKTTCSVLFHERNTMMMYFSFILFHHYLVALL